MILQFSRQYRVFWPKFAAYVQSGSELLNAADDESFYMNVYLSNVCAANLFEEWETDVFLVGDTLDKFTFI